MLTATVLASGMAFLDSTVVTVALPTIRQDLGTGLSGLQWIVNGYMLSHQPADRGGGARDRPLQGAESRSDSTGAGLDYGGALPGVVALGAITYALIRWGAEGGTPAVWTGAVVGRLSLVAFLLVEAAKRDPMLPLDLFRSVPFSVTNASTGAIYAALGTLLFLMVIHLQEVAGYSPISAGAASLPLTILMLTLSARSGKLAARVGPRPQLVVGPLLLAGGLVWLSRLGEHAPFCGVSGPPMRCCPGSSAGVSGDGDSPGSSGQSSS